MDRDFLQEWLHRQITFPRCFLPRQRETILAAKEASLEQDELVAVGSQEAFMVWERGLEEEDTGRPVAELWGAGGELHQWPSLLQQSAERLPDLTLLIEIEPQSDLRQTLSHNGFDLERHVITREPQKHDLSTAQQSRYRLRAGRELDRTLLCTLAADHMVHTLPPGREDDLALYTASILRRFRTLDFGPDSDYELLIAEEDRRAVGYILLHMTAEGAYLLDTGVRRSHWGKYVAQFMTRATENLLVDHGVDLLYAEVSAANRRSFVTACRSLKFQHRLDMWLRSP